MISALLNSSSPLMLAGIGALLSDLSGSLGIFAEGFMTLGAFFSWTIAASTGSVFLGTLASAALAAAAAWALARFVLLSGANPFIAGLAVNVAASGITASLSAVHFGSKGVLQNLTVKIPGPLVIPVIEKIPMLGTLLSGYNPFTYTAWVLAALTAIMLSRSVPGRRLIAAGESPEAALERGLRPGVYREGAWALAAFFAALGGAAVTFRVGAYAPGGIAGRGWIALAAVYLGFRKPWGVVFAALLFSAIERFGYGVQGFALFSSTHGAGVTALLGLPSAGALVLYSAALWIKNRKPKKRSTEKTNDNY